MIKTIAFDQDYSMTINGTLVGKENTFDAIDPATEQVIAKVPEASKENVDEAVKAAREAFKSWSNLSPEERGEYVYKFGEALERYQEELMSLLTLEQGKPRHSGAKIELEMSIQWCKEVSKSRLEPKIIEDTDEHVVEQHYVPLGVVGGITPWNFPVLLGVWKIVPALMAGNTMVLKPSPYTPLCTLKIGEIANEVFPPGVLNVLSGGNELGQWITEHPDINKISFTGSIATGKKVMASSATNLKRITLELGGNDAAIVLPDADPKELVEDLFWAAYGNSGQWCIAIKRLYVHEEIYDEFLSELVAFAKTIKVGNGKDPETDLGPLQNKMQYEKVKNLLADIKNTGLNVVLGGDVEEDKPGYFIPVTIVDNPPADSRVVKEEPFGPVLPVIKYNDFDDVIEQVNNTSFGLAGSVWGKDIELAKSLAKRMECGTVWVNEIHIHGTHIPFGGHKESGMGVENGFDGLAEFTNTKIYMFKK